MPLHGPPGAPHGGMPQQQGQPNMAPQNPGQGQVPPEIMELLRRVLTTMPDQPTGSAGINSPIQSVPAFARQPTVQEGLLQMLTGLLEQGQPGSNAASGLQGFRGGPQGVLGGRPRGS